MLREPAQAPGFASALRADPRTYRRTLVGVVLLAVLVRLVALLILRPHVGIDSQSYVSQGQTILQNGPLSFLSFAAEQSPLYSLLYALCDAIAGPNAGWAIGVVQAVFGGLIALLVAVFTARGTRDPFAGVLAGTIAALHITFIFWSVYVLTDTLLLVLLALSMYCLLRLVSSRHPLLDGLITSAVLLLLVLTRRTNALASGVLLITGAILARRQRLALLGLALPVVLAGAVLVTSAARARTGAPLEDRVGAYAWQAVYMGLQWTEQGRATEGVDIHLSTIPDDAARGEFYRNQSLTWMRQDPGFVALQAVRKFKVMWLPFVPEDSAQHKLLSTLYLVPFYALGLLGWLKSRRNGPFMVITTVGVAVFTVVCLITFVDYDQRYRLPAELFLIPLSGVGLEQVLGWRGAVSVGRAPRMRWRTSSRHGASAG